MYTTTSLGVAASNYYCTTKTCFSRNAATKRIFIDLQRQIIRLSPQFGIAKIADDGEIGPKTLAAMVFLADRLTSKLGVTADSVLGDLLLEINDRNATTVTDLANNAESIIAALKRDGVSATYQPPAQVATQSPVVIEVTPAAGGAVVPAAGGGAAVPADTRTPRQSATSQLPDAPAMWKVWTAIGGATLIAVGAAAYFGRRGRA